MSIGFPQAKTDLDARSGNVCLSLRNAFDDIERFAGFLAGKSVDDLVALTYTTEEATELKTNFGVLDTFRLAFEGTQAIPSPVNVKGFTVPFTGVA